jgi:hypothetical protein
MKGSDMIWKQEGIWNFANFASKFLSKVEVLQKFELKVERTANVCAGWYLYFHTVIMRLYL